jgi:hypothetical protein
MMEASAFAVKETEMSRKIAAIAGIFVLSACATPEKGMPVSGAELKQLLPGTQIESTGFEGSAVVAHYAADGHVSESWNGLYNGTGTWRVEGDAVCLSWDRQSKPTWQDGCWAAEKMTNGTLRFVETQGPTPGEVTVHDAMIRHE